MAASAAPMMRDEDAIDFRSLTSLHRDLQDYETGKRNERDEAEQARRYRHGDQWTAEEVRVHRDRGQPTITYNLVAKKLNGIVGLVERLRQDPKAFPRTPQHQKGADVATAVLNDVLDTNRWKSLSPMVASDGGVEPVAGIELSLEPGDRGDLDVALHYLEPDTIFYDPRSSREDFSDARYLGIAKWVAIDDAIDMFPDHEDALRDAATAGAAFDALQDTDRQRSMNWTAGGAKRVRLVEHWYKRHGAWLYQFYCGDLDLDRGVSPFADEKGRTFCRFILFSANVDHDNDRYGFMRNFKGPQDEVNYRRSAAVFHLYAKQVKVTAGLQGDDINALRAEVHRGDGVIVVPPGSDLEILNNADRFQGNLEMLREAKGTIEGFGPDPSLIGGLSGSTSGRAIQLLQQAGIAELGPYILGYRDWKNRVYRAVWNTVRRYWTAERFIRVTDDQGFAQFLAVNRLGTDPSTGLPAIENYLGSLDVDIIIDEGPDHTTLMEDTLDAVMQIAPNMPPESKPGLLQIVIELANLPQDTKNKLLGVLDQISQPNPLAQQAQQIQLQGAAAKVAEVQARAQKLRADAERAQVEGARALGDAAEQQADTRLKHAKAADTETDVALKFLPPTPAPFGPAELPFASGLPGLAGLPPRSPLAPLPPGY